MMKHFKYLVLLAIVYCCIAAPRLCFPDFDHSDDYSDADIMVSGENFLKFGFVKAQFLPMFDVQLDKPGAFYLHYPSLTSVINGVQQLIFKTESLYPYRAMALLATFLNIVFWYLFIRRFSGSYLVAFLAALFYMSNPISLFSADSLHQLSYADFVRSFILFLFLIAATADISARSRKAVLWSIWGLIAIEALITFEYIVYLSVFFVLFRAFSKTAKKNITWRDVIFLLAANVFGVMVHFAQNIWHFNSVSLAFRDLKNIAVERMTSSKDAPVPDLNLRVWWKYVIASYFSVVFMFNYFIWALIAFFSYLLYRGLGVESKGRIRRLARLGLLITLCGISWYVLFPSHSVAHSFVLFLSRHLVPIASLLFGTFFYMWFTSINEKNGGSIFLKIIATVCTAYFFMAGINNSELPVTGEKIAHAQEFAIVKSCLYSLKDQSGPHDEIGINYYRRPFVRYYTHRRCNTIMRAEDLKARLSLPKYFIYIPYNNENSQALLKALNEKYDTFYQCPASRFPGIFMRLKKDNK